jgi:N-acetylglucosaminyldiphosphoundecaprenol N-acetyl-beta-D-mannosaminyltransferase
MIAEGRNFRVGGLAARHCRVLGVPIDPLSMSDVLDLVDRTIEGRGRLLIGVVNAAKLVHMRKDTLLRDAVLCADVILADGMAVVWASRLLQQRVPERVAGIDLMHAMLQQGDHRGYRVYCLGATDEVLETAVGKIRSDYPGVVVVGKRNGYFHADQEAGIVADIRSTRADILLAAMSPPKKEQFLARWAEELRVPVCHGVGGAFDVMAGKVRRAPLRWQRLGLEWLYRVLQEPRRLWRRYLVTNTIFSFLLLSEMLRRRRHSPARRAVAEVAAEPRLVPETVEAVSLMRQAS